MRNFSFLIGLTLFLLSSSVTAQNIGINEDGSAPDASAILDIKSIDKGLLVPRLTTAQRTGIAAPATGLIVYDTNTSGFWYYDGGAWVEIASGAIASNTLDGAYDEGGPGAGRIIDADAGAVVVQGLDGFEVSGVYNSGAAITSAGAGARMFFNPRKAAFRAGAVSGTDWDNANVGGYSIALGQDNRASASNSVGIGTANEATGATSIAIGNEMEATGTGAVALGNGSTASGTLSMVLGYNSTASGTWSTAIGHTANANGFYSVSLGGTTTPTSWYGLAGPGGTTEGDFAFALGSGALASGDYAVAVGSNTEASGAGAVAFGVSNSASGAYSTAIGQLNTASQFGTFAVGRQNTASAQYASALGFNSEASGIYATAVGTSTASGTGSFSSGSNTVASGNFSVAMGSSTQATGTGSFAAGSGADATNNYAFAFGLNTTASGTNAAAFGVNSAASGNGSFAAGNSQATGTYGFSSGSFTVASGNNSFAGGTGSEAAGLNSVALGQTTEANGNASTALNLQTLAQAFASTALGRYNVGTGNPTLWVPTDPLLEVGIGASPFARNNALTILKNGNMGIMNANPDATLDVVGSFQLVNGTQAAGRVLTSDANGNATWAVPAGGGGTLDESYDEGGAGAGRIIDADAGAVAVQGTDGLEVTGFHNNGATIGTPGAGSRMIFNPRKSAFRSGNVTGTQWNDINVGPYSVAMGQNTTASGTYSMALNQNTFAEALGSTAIGRYNVGTGNPVTWVPTDPLFEIGIGISAASRTNAVTVLKNGNTGIMNPNPDATLDVVGSFQLVNGTEGVNRILVSDANGFATWSPASSLGGSLDNAYDSGGAGAGRTIFATDGAVEIAGLDGILVSGTLNSGATIGNPGAGTRMFFNPRKAAFRAGRVTGTQWNDASVGTGSAAFGINNTVSGSYSVAFGGGNDVSSTYSVAMGENCSAQGAFSVAMGGSATAIGESAIAIGEAATANGDLAVAFSEGTANGASSLAHGRGIVTAGDYEFATGEYNTLYTPNGTLTDRAFVIGNGTGPAARSNALILQKNGLLTINDEYTLPNTDGAEGQTLVTDGAGTVSWSGPIAFSAYLSTNSALTNGNLVMSTVDFTSNCTFNIAQVRFDAPVDGYYSFTINDVSQATVGSTQGIQIVNGFAIIRQATWVTESAGTTARSFTFILELSAGDIITFDKVGNRTLLGSTAYPACRISGHHIR